MAGTLVDALDSEQYLEVLRTIHELAQDQGGAIAHDEAAEIIEDLGHALEFGDAAEALHNAGYEKTNGRRTRTRIPIMGTGDVDPFPYGGGVVIYDASEPDARSFTWWWWDGPDDTEDEDATYEVYGYTFDLDDDLMDDLVNWIDAELAASADTTVEDLRSSAKSSDLREKLRFLHDVVSVEGPYALDGEPLGLSRREIQARFGLFVDEVAGRRADQVDAELVRIGVYASGPSQDDVSQWLATINAHRAAIGMRPLDPAAAGWTADDLREEAERIAAVTANPAAPAVGAGCPHAHVERVLAELVTRDWRAPRWGGRADGMSVRQFSPDQLARGACVELEHTADVATAVRIAMDHIVEMPDYYPRLARMERQARRDRAGR